MASHTGRRGFSIDASRARWIVDEVRAFYTFLKREFGLKQADSCLQVLGNNAVTKLEAAMSDNTNFGMTKSLFMAGADAGFDMQSTDGIEAWMQSLEGKPVPSSIPIRRHPQSTSKKDKMKRKAARKARKP